MAKSLFNKSLNLFNNSSVSTKDTILISVNLWKAANNLLHKNVKMDSDSRLQLDQISSDLEWYINQKKESTSYIESLTNQIKSSKEISKKLNAENKALSSKLTLQSDIIEKLNTENKALSSKLTLQSDIIEKFKKFEKMSKKKIGEQKEQILELIAMLDHALIASDNRNNRLNQHMINDGDYKGKLDAVFNSISWKVTAPFRWFSKILFLPIQLLKALTSKNKTKSLKQLYHRLPLSIKHNRTILKIKDKYLERND